MRACCYLLRAKSYKEIDNTNNFHDQCLNLIWLSGESGGDSLTFVTHQLSNVINVLGATQIW